MASRAAREAARVICYSPDDDDGRRRVAEHIDRALAEERAAVRELVQRVEDLNGDTYLYGIGEIEREALTHSRTEVSKAIARLKEVMGET